MYQANKQKFVPMNGAPPKHDLCGKGRGGGHAMMRHVFEADN